MAVLSTVKNLKIFFVITLSKDDSTQSSWGFLFYVAVLKMNSWMIHIGFRDKWNGSGWNTNMRYTCVIILEFPEYATSDK